MMFTFTRPLLDASRVWKAPGTDERFNQVSTSNVQVRARLEPDSVLRTEHVLQADDAGEVVVEVDVVVGVGEPQADQLQELVVELHAFTGTKQQIHKRSDGSQNTPSFSLKFYNLFLIECSCSLKK